MADWLQLWLKPCRHRAFAQAATSPPLYRMDGGGEPGEVIDWLHRMVRCQGGQDVPGTSLLRDNLIGIYFSASWCPPCQTFTPLLAEAYQKIRTKHGERAFEVVLVPLDTLESQWSEYIKGMPWLSLHPAARECVVRIFMHFDIHQIPTLVVVNAKGEIVSRNARGGQGFGFGCDPLEAYDSLREAAAALAAAGAAKEKSFRKSQRAHPST
mmetsp:Transcript_41668/g.94028  ORF Transcript_41668/g.94028 Transcript_41668/m.94028 type:complete len:211 (+) Transcript_41668:3-635(+)